MNEQTLSRHLETHALAIVSLVLSILGLAAVLPLVGPIGAIVSGRIARREIQANPERYTGDGLARAGIVLGWVGLALDALIALAICAALMFFMTVRVEGGPSAPVVVPVQP